MRTTLTLDPDVELLVKRAMRQTGANFKAVVNDALRRSLGQSAQQDFEMPPPVVGGQPRIDINSNGAVWADLDREDMQRHAEQPIGERRDA